MLAQCVTYSADPEHQTMNPTPRVSSVGCSRTDCGGVTKHRKPNTKPRTSSPAPPQNSQIKACQEPETRTWDMSADEHFSKSLRGCPSYVILDYGCIFMGIPIPRTSYVKNTYKLLLAQKCHPC